MRVTDYRVGDYVVLPNKSVHMVTAVDENNIYCGPFYTASADSVGFPRLSDDFFKRNDFVRSKLDGSWSLGCTDEACNCILAKKKEDYYEVRIQNGPFLFMGVMDSVNEFIHAVSLCAINGDFVCD